MFVCLFVCLYTLQILIENSAKLTFSSEVIPDSVNDVEKKSCFFKSDIFQK